MIVLSTEAMRVVVDEEHGAEIVFLGRPGGPNVLAYYDWRTPLPAGQSVTYGSTILDWHAGYRGGWQELFPNAGDECSVEGVQLPYHGEVSWARWAIVERSPAHVTLRVASRLPLVLEREMRVDETAPILTVRETVANEAAFRVPYIWGHHAAFATAPGCRIDLPAATIHVDAAFDPDLSDLLPGAPGHWPLAPDKRGGTVDLRHVSDGQIERFCYLVDLEAGWAALRPPAPDGGVALAWDVRTFPHAWFWQEMGGRDFPWYGRAWLTAIEPCCAWPADGLARAIGRGQAHWIDSNDCASTWLTAALFDATNEPVMNVERDGTIQWQRSVIPCS